MRELKIPNQIVGGEDQNIWLRLFFGSSSKVWKLYLFS